MKLHIPNELTATGFLEGEADFSNKETMLWNSELYGITYFPYETLFYNKVSSFIPWEHTEQSVPALFVIWKDLNCLLESLFSERKAKEAILPMKQGLSLLFSALFWINGYPVQLINWKQRIEKFSFLPVNLTERLEFIISRPALFHSYKQLKEIFQELEKIYYKNMALKKSSKRKA